MELNQGYTLYALGECPNHPECKDWVEMQIRNETWKICFECWNESRRQSPIVHSLGPR